MASTRLIAICPVRVRCDMLIVCVAQIPRLYDIYKAQGLIDNFEQLLDNIFTPLFEVTVDPNTHPQLHLFLKTVGPDVYSLSPDHMHAYTKMPLMLMPY